MIDESTPADLPWTPERKAYERLMREQPWNEGRIEATALSGSLLEYVVKMFATEVTL